MSSRNVKLAAIVAAVTLAVGLTISLTTGSKAAPPTHANFVHDYVSATLGKTTLSTVLQTWPKKTYQDYHDGTGNRCLEWFEQPGAILYDLCFNKVGILISKQTP